MRRPFYSRTSLEGAPEMVVLASKDGTVIRVPADWSAERKQAFLRGYEGR